MIQNTKNVNNISPSAKLASSTIADEAIKNETLTNKKKSEEYKLTSGLHKIVIFAKAKSEYNLLKKIIFGVMGSIFVGLAYVAYISIVALADHADASSLILSKFFASMVFPVGILIIVFLGGNLFTSNCLISLSVHLKVIRKRDFMMDLFIVFWSNLLGAVIFGFTMGLAGYFDASFNMVLIETATAKLSSVNNSIFYNTLFSGIFCNILVAGAIFAYTVLSEHKGVATFIVYIMIATFGILGFQHIVANMTLFSSSAIASLLSGVPLGVPEQLPTLDIDYSGITSNEDFFFRALLINFPITTIGNLIGGIFISEIYFYAEAERLKKHKGINIFKKISHLRYDKDVSKKN